MWHSFHAAINPHRFSIVTPMWLLSFLIIRSAWKDGPSEWWCYPWPATTVAECLSCVRQHWETCWFRGIPKDCVLFCPMWFMQYTATVHGRCLMPVTCQVTTLMSWPVALELVNSMVQLLPSLGCELHELGSGGLCDDLVWWSTTHSQDVTQRSFLCRNSWHTSVMEPTLPAKLGKNSSWRKSFWCGTWEWQTVFMLWANECIK